MTPQGPQLPVALGTGHRADPSCIARAGLCPSIPASVPQCLPGTPPQGRGDRGHWHSSIAPTMTPLLHPPAHSPDCPEQRGSVAPWRDLGKGQFSQQHSLCPGNCHTVMLSRTKGQELLQGSLCPLMGGTLTPASCELPECDVGLGIPASSSTSRAFPAAVSLETGSRKGHPFPFRKGGWTSCAAIPSRKGDG